MMFFSFNKSRLATVWGGFSTQWYGKLFQNQQVLDAAWLSFRIAFLTATFATILGTMAGMALARFARFRGRTLFSGLVSAPLVMPEVITGISLLLFFIGLEYLIGWPNGRGFTTITIAHITFSLSYVAVVVQSRLASMDRSVEEAAMDLGSKPLRVLFDVTLPDHRAGDRLRLAPGLHAVARRRRHHHLHQRPGIDDVADLHLLEGAARRHARHQCARHHHRRPGRHRRRHRRLDHVSHREEARARHADGDRGE